VTVRLHLRDLRDGRVSTFETGPVVVGRAAGCQLVVSGEGRELVSGSHARCVFRDGVWTVEDAGGRNGTFLDGRRVRPGAPEPIASGQMIGLGERGPKFKVEIERVAPPAPPVPTPTVGPNDATLPLSTFAPPPAAPAPAAAVVAVALVQIPGGERHEAKGGRLRVGRGQECEIRLTGSETVVSRVHCEIVLRPDGVAVLRDARSRNGTLCNGQVITSDQPLARGHRIQLGPQGPELRVDGLAVQAGGPPLTPPTPAAPPRPEGAAAASRPAAAPVATPPPSAEPAMPAAASGAPRRSFGGMGRTLFVRQIIQETEQKHASRVRTVIWTFVALLLVGVAGVFWFSERQVRETQAELAAQRAALEAARVMADSTRAAALAEYQELTLALAQARAGSAPAAVVDSLRTALKDARSATASLEVALNRARSELGQQLATGDSLRRASELETERLRGVLATSQAGGVSAAQLDSLRREVQAAERRAATLESGLRAVRGADLARIAEANQAAVGLVTTFAGEDIYDGSGFVVAKSGYFVTNRHVVRPDGRAADSIHVTLADQRTGYRTTLVAVADQGGPDLAVLWLPRYVGPYVARADWDGTLARQGEPAALIGFPAGAAAALDATSTVRTSMSAGIFSKVTPTSVQFDGFTVGGSSGSPVFNADGVVVAVHAAGLREAAGLGFAVPVRLVLPLLPEEVRQEVIR
jgi:pSer/pThr/pTyr-binding forkhead associated (FHA) protein/S1-C subfamily serine protease